ncbi:hypothetical protein ERX46_05585 [Brumimicrobium glaciale]|uniref:Uncharacterized protein n=1 Tax=Brumimicrobium glaciale TaxID=200475 RepID=A0A4Q4KPQ7_9FLAO|nr:hypothetical protein [Brumimicrobium glaciale]RYM34847.1 hypothetical protein ERX46_05585 [Brumimicrobium glaciale]
MKIRIAESFKFRRRITILLCAVISPLVFYKLYNWVALIEALRVDDYSYGALFYLVVFSVCLTTNAVIVHLLNQNSSKDEKIRLWIKGSLIAPLFGLTFILLYFFIDILIHGARWNFG